MAKKSATAIYCDDIRQEIGGNYSWMGIYNTDIIFSSFPSMLPKLCAHVTVKFPWGEQPKNSLRVVLFKGEKVLSKIQVDQQSLQAAKLPPPIRKHVLKIELSLASLALIFLPFK
jgi:hypothetical protein